MPRRAIWAAILVLAVSLASPAEAQRSGPVRSRGRRARVERVNAPARTRARTRRGSRRGNRDRLERIRRTPNPLKRRSTREKRTVKRFLKSRRKWIRNRAELFRSITVDRDYTDNYVLHRDAKVTAFLDWSDPSHPLYDPSRSTGEQHMLASIPPERRAHILVVPNRPREHVAKKLGGQIEAGDVEATLETMNAAKKIARDLGIRDPKIYVNSESAISVGYLHVHIVGERPADRPYPAPLESPAGP